MFKSVIKNACSFIVLYGGIFFLVRTINNLLGRRLTILTYHRVTDMEISSIKSSLPYLFVTKRMFEDQLKFIKKHYTIITFETLYDILIGGENIPKNSLIITFDDGYEDNYQQAFPSQKKLNVPAVFFLTANKVGNKDSFVYWWDRAYYLFSHYRQWYSVKLHSAIDEEIQSLINRFKRNPSSMFSFINTWDTNKIESLLDTIESKYDFSSESIFSENRILRWDQIRMMGESFELGSHGSNHTNLVALEKEQMLREIRGSSEIIKNMTGRRVFAFSYPYGNYNEEIRKMVSEAGYEFAVTTKTGINSLKDRYALKRINIWEGTCRSYNGKFSKSLFAYNLLGLA